MPPDRRPHPPTLHELSNRLGEQARDTLVRLLGQRLQLFPELLIDLPADSHRPHRLLPVIMTIRGNIMKLEESQTAAADRARRWVAAALAYGPFPFVPISDANHS